jgi:hypothetical protein
VTNTPSLPFKGVAKISFLGVEGKELGSKETVELFTWSASLGGVQDVAALMRIVEHTEFSLLHQANINGI